MKHVDNLEHSNVTNFLEWSGNGGGDDIQGPFRIISNKFSSLSEKLGFLCNTSDSIAAIFQAYVPYEISLDPEFLFFWEKNQYSIFEEFDWYL